MRRRRGRGGGNCEMEDERSCNWRRCENWLARNERCGRVGSSSQPLQGEQSNTTIAAAGHTRIHCGSCWANSLVFCWQLLCIKPDLRTRILIENTFLRLFLSYSGSIILIFKLGGLCKMIKMVLKLDETCDFRSELIKTLLLKSITLFKMIGIILQKTSCELGQ